MFTGQNIKSNKTQNMTTQIWITLKFGTQFNLDKTKLLIKLKL